MADDTLTRIEVSGFKSIRDQQALAIRPLTVLAGTNSSGKSSIIQPLLLLKQTLESHGDPGALLLNGPNVCFHSADQMLSRMGKSVSDSFRIAMELNGGRRLDLTFGREPSIGLDLTEMVYSAPEEEIALRPGMSPAEILQALPKPLKGLGNRMWSVRRDRCFFSYVLDRGNVLSQDEWALPSWSPAISFTRVARRMIHLPGLRGNPMRNYPRRAPGTSFSGTFEPYVASVIADWQGDPSDGKAVKQLNRYMQLLGLTWKVHVSRVDDAQLEIKVGRLRESTRGGARDLVSIADVGFGVSQSLPVAVALVAAEPGQVVYLEQPEIHLHPRAQRDLAEILVEAAKEKTLIVETHSAILLRAIQTLVAKGSIAKEDVAFHWFSRDAQGQTKITEATIADDGSYGAWPEDFDITELEAEQEYLDAVEARGAHS